MQIDRVRTDIGGHLIATIAGEDWSGIELNADNRFAEAVRAWIAAGNTPEPYTAPVTIERISNERDRRIALGAHVTINGTSFVVQTRDEVDFRNINGLVSQALVLAIMGDTATKIPFRDAADVVHQLTGTEMIALGQQVAAHVSARYAAAWTIKALTPIPADYASDARWPA